MPPNAAYYGSGMYFFQYDSVAEYNLSHPDRQFPEHAGRRNALRGYTAAGAGLENDLGVWPRSCTLDFLPGGAPEPDEQDRIGSVVVSQWGDPPLGVLADGVSLRAAWSLIRHHWPTRLSEARDALAPLLSVAAVW